MSVCSAPGNWSREAASQFFEHLLQNQFFLYGALPPPDCAQDQAGRSHSGLLWKSAQFWDGGNECPLGRSVVKAEKKPQGRAGQTFSEA